MEEISIHQLRKKLDDLTKNETTHKPVHELILDVRSPQEFAESHIPKSKNIPYDQVEKHLEELKNFDQIYIHCRLGGRAQIACQQLEQLGLKNIHCVTRSGMDEWTALGFPIER
jgi:rhodanese-related sulfurtransferase